MRSIVTYFLRLEILNLHPMVYWGLAGIWLLLLLSAFASVRSLIISPAAKIVWVVVILALPILGLAIYAIRCLVRANWKGIKPFFQLRKVDRQLSAKVPPVKPPANP